MLTSRFILGLTLVIFTAFQVRMPNFPSLNPANPIARFHPEALVPCQARSHHLQSLK